MGSCASTCKSKLEIMRKVRAPDRKKSKMIAHNYDAKLARINRLSLRRNQMKTDIGNKVLEELGPIEKYV